MHYCPSEAQCDGPQALLPETFKELMGQLRQIQMQEAREFGVHGWNLPDDDRERIRDQLARLDHLVDETRDEQ